MKYKTLLLSIAVGLITACGGGGSKSESPAGTGTPAETESPQTSPLTVNNHSLNTLSIQPVLRAALSKPFNPLTLTASSVLLTDSDNSNVDITIDESQGQFLTIKPIVPLNRNTTYTVTLTTDIEDASGNTLAEDYSWSFTTTWTMTIASEQDDRAVDVVVDKDGNLYSLVNTTGSIASGENIGFIDVVISKHDENGQLLWSKQSGSTGDDLGSGLAITNDALYAVVTTNEEFSVISKYDLEGALLLRVLIKDDTFDYEVSDIATDGTDIFITGSIYKSGNTTNIILLKVNSDLDIVWERQIGSTLDNHSGYDVANGIAVDESYIYITGETTGVLDGAEMNGNQGMSDVFVAQFDKLGSMLWVRQYGTETEDEGQAITVDDNAIYVTGITESSLGYNVDDYVNGDCIYALVTSPCNDAFVSKISKLDGSPLWTYQIGSIGDDIGGGVQVEQGNVYAMGLTGGNIGTQILMGDFDHYTIKLNSEGKQVWLDFRSAGISTANYLYGMFLHNGFLYLAGSTDGDFDGIENMGSKDAIIIKYDLDGNAL